MRWVLGRGGVLAPRVRVSAWLWTGALAVAFAGLLWWHGVALAAGVAVGELVVLTTLLLLCARHAGDCETLTLADGALVVEHHRGARTERTAFRAVSLRVEPAHGQGSLVELTGGGRCARVGRYLRPELRLPLAQELRRALRASAARCVGGADRMQREHE